MRYDVHCNDSTSQTLAGMVHIVHPAVVGDRSCCYTCIKAKEEGTNGCEDGHSKCIPVDSHVRLDFAKMQLSRVFLDRLERRSEEGTVRNTNLTYLSRAVSEAGNLLPFVASSRAPPWRTWPSVGYPPCRAEVLLERKWREVQLPTCFSAKCRRSRHVKQSSLGWSLAIAWMSCMYIEIEETSRRIVFLYARACICAASLAATSKPMRHM